MIYTKVHILKTLPEYFQQVVAGIKTFEVRENDHNFQVGDILRLKEYIPETGLTGRRHEVKITYILPGGDFGISKDYVVMSIIPSFVKLAIPNINE